jgi:hypothetical protein
MEKLQIFLFFQRSLTMCKMQIDQMPSMTKQDPHIVTKIDSVVIMGADLDAKQTKREGM